MGLVRVTGVVVVAIDDQELAIAVVIVEDEALFVATSALKEVVSIDELDTDEVVEVVLKETIYIWRPLGPPQI